MCLWSVKACVLQYLLQGQRPLLRLQLDEELWLEKKRDNMKTPSAKSNGPKKQNRDVKFQYNLPGALTATGRLGGTTLAAGLNLWGGSVSTLRIFFWRKVGWFSIKYIQNNPKMKICDKSIRKGNLNSRAGYRFSCPDSIRKLSIRFSIFWLHSVNIVLIQKLLIFLKN